MLHRGLRAVTRALAAALFVAATLGSSASTAQSRPGGQSVTFSKDIAPILFGRCAGCHHPDGPAPFSLLTYEAARSRAALIAAVTSRRVMPPWKADPVAGGFVGQPHLGRAEIDLLDRWAEQGAIEGDPRDAPPAPRIARGWQLGQPDLVLAPARPYELAARGTDVFRIFVIPIPADRPRFVRGLEFRPGSPKVVHHANIRIDRTEASRRFDEADPAPGYEGLIARSAAFPDGHFLGWTPGQVAPLLPTGLAWRLDPGTDLVVEMHMQPSGRVESVLPSIGVFFGDEPPARTPTMIRLGRQSIDIPPEEKAYRITDSFELPVDVEVQAVQPHAHYRARDVRGTATLPDGTTRTLIHIGDWDFRWQHVYRYAAPFSLPKGTRLGLEYTFDNSSGNPRNPQLPPARVFWGQRSRDEMGDLWVQVLTRSDEDLQALARALGPKVLTEDVIGYEREIQRDPSSVALHDDVAQALMRLGRYEEAVAHFSESVRLNPSAAPTHFNLGTALAVANRLDEAQDEYRRALAIRPDYPQAHNNLGSLLLQRGQAADALTHLGEAIRLDPANVEAHYNLAAAHAALDDVGRAVEILEGALKLSPAEPLASAVRDRLATYQRRQRE
jgi:Flp pilus assembly protein TadD